jgi:peptidoglycan/xylan/chitin deacetylase (PgdA/CDA1 family)
MSTSERFAAMAAPAARPRTRVWRPTPAIRASICLHAACVLLVVTQPAWWPFALAAFLGNHLVLGLVGMHPRSRLLGPNLIRLPDDAAARGEVALTFDDGPDPAITPRVLDVLDRHGAKASFFCIGRRAAAHPDLLREIVRRGHSVENHSDRHLLGFSCCTPSMLRREINVAQTTIEHIAGSAPRFFRAPLGLRSPLLDPVMAGTRLQYISWTRRGRDCATRDPTKVLRRLTHGLAAGDVLLLHDARCSRARSGDPIVLRVLPELLRQLAASGLRPVSLRQAISVPMAPDRSAAGF